MAYPGTYNISYYRGDTLEFRIYPKDSSGASMDLTDYTPLFTISTSRGEDGLLDQIPGYVAIDDNNEYIICVITPEVGDQLSAGTQYVYDVEISKTAELAALPYDVVTTLLTGTISITDQVGVSDLGGS